MRKSAIAVLAAMFVVGAAPSLHAATEHDWETYIDAVATGAEEGIKAALDEVLPPGVVDVVAVLKDSPEIVRAALIANLQRKMQQAAIDDDMSRMNRYQAFLDCLSKDDCAKLRTITHASGGTADSGSGTNGTNAFADIPAFTQPTAGACDWQRVSPAFATVEKITGDVSARTGEGEWCDAVVGLKLIAHDDIHTGPDSIAVVTFFEGSVLNVYQQTETAIGDLDASNRPKIRMLLKMGEIAAKVHHETDQQADFAIRTPNQTASVRGTDFVVAYDPNEGATFISVKEGEVLVTPANTAFKPVLVPAHGLVSVFMEGVKTDNMPIP